MKSDTTLTTLSAQDTRLALLQEIKGINHENAETDFNLTEKGVEAAAKMVWLSHFARETREVSTEEVNHFLRHYGCGKGDWTGGVVGGQHKLDIILHDGSKLAFFSPELMVGPSAKENLAIVLDEWSEIHLVTRGRYAPKGGLIARRNNDGTAQVFRW
ncbi:hypothetical protein [Conchiformibius steedae]|uniref:hypothetical protein n=1 Tax=Conchiformibius steedae TaxID=153493 RepID=UPI0026F2C042|nr:hypothetical protein [Conchiformibius steedae]